MAKKYEYQESEPMMASEPVGACRVDTFYSIQPEGMTPCTYTDEEFKEELAMAESEGFISDEEFKKSCLEKWGVAL